MLLPESDHGCHAENSYPKYPLDYDKIDQDEQEGSYRKKTKVEHVTMDEKLTLEALNSLPEDLLTKISEVKNFYNQSAAISSQSSLRKINDPSLEDRKGKKPILTTEDSKSFIEEFQIPWYISEAACFYPDTSSMTEIPYSVKRDRNLWYLCKEIHSSWNNLFPFPNFEIGDQAELKFPGDTRELSLLLKNTNKKGGKEEQWEFGPVSTSKHIDDYRYMNRSDLRSCKVKKIRFPAHLSQIAAIDYFLESEDLYFKQLPHGYATKSARKTLIVESYIVQTTLSGNISGKNISYNLPDSLLPFSLDSLKVYFIRTKEYHEFRVFFDTRYLETIMQDRIAFRSLSNFFQDHLKTQLMNPELGNTLEFVPRSPKEGFGLQLYDYQKRSLQWMYQVEKKEGSTSSITRGETTHFARFDSLPDAIINFSEDSIIKNHIPYFDRIDYTCLGGILADNPGYGKTITTLALIHSNPLDSFTSLPLTRVQKYYLFPSRATLIICPSNLVKQWQAEVKKCFPNTVRCYTVSWIIEHRKLSWSDVIQADIIIVSVSFLANQNYHKFLTEKFNKYTPKRYDINYWNNIDSSSKNDEPYFASTMRKIIPKRSELIDIPGSVNFEAIYWYRIVFDEFHELEIAEKSARGIAKSLKGLYHWGMTGTPAFKTPHDIRISAEFLSVEFDPSPSSIFGRCLSFKSNFIRRNNEDLDLPPLIDEIEWVKLSPPEMALYNVRSSDSEIEAFMACSHYQISEEVVLAAGDTILSIDTVSELLCKRLIDTCTNLSLEILQTKEVIDQIKKELNRNRFDALAEKQKVKREYEREMENLGRKQTEYDLKSRELHYFRGVMNALEKDSLDESCLICLEELRKEQNLCITKCGHVYCVQCVSSYLAAQFPNPKVCPKCRQILKKEEVMLIDPKSAAESMNAEKAKEATYEEKEHLAKCGSKISVMINRLKQIQVENSNAKVIIFCQFRRLANIIHSTLEENEVSVARVHGSHSIRSTAINEFKSNPECSVIMLSTEDSVSGLHLPEATHIFIMHPFWFGSSREAIEKAISAEKQGIARAYRLGLKHPLKVIRFYTRDTIEETCSKDRSIV